MHSQMVNKFMNGLEIRTDTVDRLCLALGLELKPKS
jgi:hypothetical protein